MADAFEIDADASEWLKALDQIAGPVLEKHLMGAARETGKEIQREGQARARRRTGQMAGAITISEDTERLAVNVFYGPMGSRPREFPLYHEYGTRKMSKQPALTAAGRLEEGAHRRRIEGAIQSAAEEVGGA